jgi:hypothetical protein
LNSRIPGGSTSVRSHVTPFRLSRSWGHRPSAGSGDAAAGGRATCFGVTAAGCAEGFNGTAGDCAADGCNAAAGCREGFNGVAGDCAAGGGDAAADLTGASGNGSIDWTGGFVPAGAAGNLRGADLWVPTP